MYSDENVNDKNMPVLCQWFCFKCFFFSVLVLTSQRLCGLQGRCQSQPYFKANVPRQMIVVNSALSEEGTIHNKQVLVHWSKKEFH